MDSIEISDIPSPRPRILAPRFRDRLHLEKTETGSLLKREGALLVLVSGALSLSWVIPWLQSEHLWPSIPCLFYRITGIPCLTCGLTRSFSFTAHGDLANAFRLHLLGPPLFLLALFAGVYLVSTLCFGIRLRIRTTNNERRLLFLLTLGLLAVCWLIKIFFLKGGW